MWLALVLAFIAACAVVRHARGEPGRYALAGAICAAPMLGFLLPVTEPAPVGLPRTTGRGLFVGSGACKTCHPSEHASWDASFHSSMTQVARGKAIAMPVGQHQIEVAGGFVQATHEGGKLTIRMPDPEALSTMIEREAVLTTGSHHYQAYWVKGGRDGELRAAPFVWHIEAERFIPRHDVFLQPPDQPDARVRWNSNCLVCHATAAEPRHDPERDVFETQAVELGIACESCHGPGGPHADRYRDPFARYAAREPGERNTHIKNPQKLDKQRSTELCGQCHSYAIPRDEEAWWSHGYAASYSAGDDLAESRIVLQPQALETSESLFWGDGTIRVGGREYNGLARSSCFVNGEGERKLGCVDCHQLHGKDPNDQLKPEAITGEVCASCHEAEASALHTRHEEGSVGASCYGCHMPRISYALYRSQRSHRVDSPNVEIAVATGRPPACNLCHVDRTLGWTAAALEKGWGIETNIALPPEDLAFVVKLALSGDAASRVIAANELVSKEAIATSGSDFQTPLLATLLDDPYAAVRFVAGRGLVEQGALSPGEYDFLAPRSTRLTIRDAVLSTWNSRRHADRSELVHPSGVLDYARLQAELARRDDRPITIAE